MSPQKFRGFLSYVSAVLISIFFVATVTFGASTISTNISTDGTLSVTGASNFTGAIYASSTLGVTGVAGFFGNVGIGTSTPGQNLSVNGVVSISGQANLADLTATGTTILAIGSSAKLGVGTTTPWGFVSLESAKGTVNADTPIFAVADSGTSTPFLVVHGGNGNIGIGTSTPWAQLSINNLAGATNPLLVVATSTALSATTTSVLIVDAAGKVGIGGTTTPSEQLTVLGNISNLLSTSSKPVIKGSALTGSNPYAIDVVGKYAYVVNQTAATFQIFDVSTSSPAHVSTTAARGTVSSDVFVNGRYAYVPHNGSDLLEIFDIGNPRNPRSVGVVTTGSGPSGVYVAGGYAYVINYTSGTLQTYDVSNPASPRGSLYSIGTGTSPYAIFGFGRYLYVVNIDSNSLQIFDIGNPEQPTLLSTTTTDTGPAWVYVSGRYAYVANATSNTLQIFDISNPYSPALLSRAAAQLGSGGSSGLTSVHVDGRYAYMANYGGGVMEVFDVVNPLAIRSMGSVSVPTNPNAVFVAGRNAYVLSAGTTLIYNIDIGGIETTSALIHSLEAGNIQARNDLYVQGLSFLGAGAQVGTGGILSQGGVYVMASTTSTDITSGIFGNRVAIGTTTPVARLTVWGSGTQNGSLLRLVNKASTTLVNILDNGNIGIGTTSPFAQLSIAATSTGTMHLFAVATSSATATSTVFLISGINGNIAIGSTSTPEGVLAIDNSTKGVPALLINAAGPGEGAIAIAVSADDTCRDSNSATCALNDLAELFPSSESIEAGDIAMFDPSDRSYIKKAVGIEVAGNPGLLAGIISTSPAIVFEGSVIKTMSGVYHGSSDKAPLALAGRVPVKVSLEGGEIRVGDPVALSSVPGVGKRATRDGRIVGYALESFSGATAENGGKVLVFADNSYWHNQEAEDGLEIKDRVTGEIYCLTVQSGNFEKIKGKCVRP